jgi:hypothetical protein
VPIVAWPGGNRSPPSVVVRLAVRLCWPCSAAATLPRKEVRPLAPEVQPILKGSLFCCAVVAAVLGVFSLGGDWLGLWQRLEPQPAPRAATLQQPKKHPGSRVRRHRVKARPSTRVTGPAKAVPQPPVPARTAFLVAALGAALAGLVSVLQSRTARRALQRAFDAFRRPPVQSVPSTRAVNAATVALRPRLSPGPKRRFLPAVPRRPIPLGSNALDVVSAPQRRSFDRAATLKLTGARAGAALRSSPAVLRSTTVKVARRASSGRSAASAAFEAAAPRLAEVRMWIRRRQSLAPYLVAVAVSVMVGWLMGTH